MISPIITGLFHVRTLLALDSAMMKSMIRIVALTLLAAAASGCIYQSGDQTFDCQFVMTSATTGVWSCAAIHSAWRE